MPNLSPDGLPIVSEATLESFLEEGIKNEGVGTLQDTTYSFLEKLQKSNPEVAVYIMSTLAVLKIQDTPEELVEWALSVQLGVYELLARRAESNKLAEQAGQSFP